MKTRYFFIMMIALGAALSACDAFETTSEHLEAQAETSLEEPNSATVEETIALTAAQMKAAGAQLGKLQPYTFHQSIRANGMVDLPPENRASVSAYFAGYVKDLRLLPGQKVRKNEVLFTLENPEYIATQQAYLETKEHLKYLKSDYERQKKLYDDQVASEKVFIQAETDYRRTLAQMAAQQQRLRMMGITPETLSAENIRSEISVRAPIEGYLGDVNVHKGMYLESSTVAATVLNTTHIHLEISVFEKDLAHIQEKQPIRFHLLNDTATYWAEVYLVARNVDSETRMVNVHAHLQDEVSLTRFAPGMYVEAEILTQPQPSLALPNSALIEVDGTFYVLVKHHQDGEAMHFQQQAVRIGMRNEQFTQVLDSTLLKNKEIMVQGGFTLLQGDS